MLRTAWSRLDAIANNGQLSILRLNEEALEGAGIHRLELDYNIKNQLGAMPTRAI